LKKSQIVLFLIENVAHLRKVLVFMLRFQVFVFNAVGSCFWQNLFSDRTRWHWQVFPTSNNRVRFNFLSRLMHCTSG